MNGKSEDSWEAQKQERENQLRKMAEEKERPETVDKRLQGPNKPSV